MILILLQCHPIHKAWDETTIGKCTRGTHFAFYACAVVHFLIELALLICPMVVVYKMRLPTAQKFGVAAMFMSGAL